MGNIYLCGFFKIHAYRAINLGFKNVQIIEIYKKTSKFHRKTIFYLVHSKNLFKNTRNFGSGFFRNFRIRVFSRNFLVRVLARTKFLDQIFTYPFLLHNFIDGRPWQALADTKNAKY